MIRDGDKEGVSMEAGLGPVPDFAVTSDDCIQTGSDGNMLLLSQFL